MATWTQEEIDAVREKIASGTASARDADGKGFNLRGQEDLLALLALMEGSAAPVRPSSIAVVRPRLSRPRAGG